MTFRTQALREEEAEVASSYLVGARVPGVCGDVATAGGGVLGEVFVLAVAAGPLVVPDVEDSAGLRWGLGFEGGWVDLRAGGAAFAADDLFDFLRGVLGVCGERGFGVGGG